MDPPKNKIYSQRKLMEVESSQDDEIREGHSKPGLGAYISTDKVLGRRISCDSEVSDSPEEIFYPDGRNSPDGSQWRRRLANDPAMMKELYRYQKLMLLTLVPSISPDNVINQSNSHPHSHVHGKADQAIEDYANLCQAQGSSRRQSITNFESLEDKVSDEMLPGLVHSYENKYDKNSKIKQGKVNTKYRRSSVGQLNIESISKDKKIYDNSSRTNNFNIGYKDQTINSTTFPDSSNLSYDGPGGNLDLLTLAALYLESRQRIFGDEWNQRQEVR